MRAAVARFVRCLWRAVLQQYLGANIYLANLCSYYFFHQNSALGFACDCGDESYTGGMCLDLISLLLATLMSVLRYGDLPKKLSGDTLTKLIEQMATLLLDARITAVGVESVNGISQKMREQIQRAANKTCIQAVLSAPAHESAMALMTLQAQFSRDTPPNDDGSNTNTRLSKIATKLMARKVKSEGSKAVPFDREKFDMDSFLCSTEDLLVTASKLDARRSAPCRDMAKTVVIAVVKARSSSGHDTAIRDALDAVAHDTDVSLTRELVASCEKELGLKPTVVTEATAHPATSINDPVEPAIAHELLDNGDSDVNSEDARSADATTATLTRLIAEVAAANDKTESVNELKKFVQSHPDVDIDSHLVPLSAPFRAFIVESLDRSEPPGGSAALSNGHATSSSPSQSMAARLEMIKAKLKVADDALNPAAGSPLSRSSATASAASSSSSAGLSSIRSRMAALNSQRHSSASVSAPAVDNAANSGTSRDTGNASASSSDALRARLERMRKNKQVEEA